MKDLDGHTINILRQAFEAGEAYANECHCGKCDYCLEVKDEDAPNFETWLKSYSND